MYKLEDLIECANENKISINNELFPARPERYCCKWHDLKDAWAVFTRKADAVVWPKGQ